MRPHGHALLVLMVSLVALAGLGTVISNRIDGRLARGQEDALRTQAIWLARSAAARARALDRQVPLPSGAARVRVSVLSGKVEAEARLPGHGTARAVVLLAPDGRPRSWQESFDAEAR